MNINDSGAVSSGAAADYAATPFWQGGMPDFDSIKSCADITAVIDDVLASQQQQIEAVIKNNDAGMSVLDRVALVENLQEQLHRIFAPVRHLHAVADNDALRAACNSCMPKISAHQASLLHNRGLYECYQQLASDPGFADLSLARRKTVTNAIRDFRLAGIDLPPAQQQRYREIEQELAVLQMRFEQNITDATDAFELHITDEARLSGLPEQVLAAAARKAADKGVAGWIIGLQAPFYQAVMAYADDAKLRQHLYTAWNCRASDSPAPGAGPDNTPLMTQVVALCQEQAELLGFESYAHYALQTRMARSPEEVLSFLRSLLQVARPAAESEIEELRVVGKRYGLSRLEPWDLGWVAEKLRQEKYDVSVDELRQFFPAQHVMKGLFAITAKLFGIEIMASRSKVNVWNDEVSYCEIRDLDGKPVGGLYMDLYARLKKRGGAWMDDCRNRTATDLPLAFLSCNFTPPDADGKSLLSHDEVVTLFHEFGHTLHHLLTAVDQPPVAGINGVPWDAVEFPSQFLENWCWQKESLAMISAHHQTGKPVDDITVQKMLAARNFHAGRFLVRQIELAMFDFRLYLECKKPTATDIQQLLDQVRAEVAVFPVPPQNRYQNSFAHIFAGGYAAGYYSYLWAEVLAADAFSIFLEDGVLNAATGGCYRSKILAQGGVHDPADLFVDFRGRPPDPAALPQAYGLDAVDTAV